MIGLHRFDLFLVAYNGSDIIFSVLSDELTDLERFKVNPID